MVSSIHRLKPWKELRGSSETCTRSKGGLTTNLSFYQTHAFKTCNFHEIIVVAILRMLSIGGSTNSSLHKIDITMSRTWLFGWSTSIGHTRPMINLQGSTHLHYSLEISCSWYIKLDTSPLVEHTTSYTFAICSYERISVTKRIFQTLDNMVGGLWFAIGTKKDRVGGSWIMMG